MNIARQCHHVRMPRDRAVRPECFSRPWRGCTQWHIETENDHAVSFESHPSTIQHVIIETDYLRSWARLDSVCSTASSDRSVYTLHWHNKLLALCAHSQSSAMRCGQRCHRVRRVQGLGPFHHFLRQLDASFASVRVLELLLSAGLPKCALRVCLSEMSNIMALPCNR